MRISIIIPIYNVEAYIERCILSVLHQTYRQLEVILVDDCSPDDSMAVAKKVIENAGVKDFIFKYIRHDHNRGLSAARNSGIKAATGEYFYLLDSDDAITADCIEKLAKPLTEERYDFVIGNFKTIGHLKELPKLKFEGYSNHVGRDYEQELWYAMAVNKLLNLQFIKDNHLFFVEGQLNEDEIWSFELAFTAKTMYAVKEDFYLYYYREGSIMSKMKEEEFIQSRFRVAGFMWDYIDSHGLAVNPSANHKIEQVIQAGHALFVISKDMEGYRYYKQIRNMNHRDRSIYRRLSCSSMSGFIKYSHYLMPVPIGFAFKVALRLPVLLKQLIKK